MSDFMTYYFVSGVISVFCQLRLEEDIPEWSEHKSSITQLFITFVFGFIVIYVYFLILLALMIKGED